MGGMGVGGRRNRRSTRARLLLRICTGREGAAGFVAQYGMAWAANRGVLEMRTVMFGRLLDAEPALEAQAQFQLQEATIDSVHKAIQSGETTCKQVIEGYFSAANKPVPAAAGGTP